MALDTLDIRGRKEKNKIAAGQNTFENEAPADGGVTSLSPNPNRTFAQANADNPGSTQPPHSNAQNPDTQSTGKPSTDRLINEREATPVTSFKDTGFGAWGKGAVSLLMPSGDGTFFSLTVEGADALSDNPAEAPKFAITKKPTGAGTASTMSYDDYVRYYGAKRPEAFKKERELQREREKIIKETGTDIFGNISSPFVFPDARKKGVESFTSNERIVSQNAWQLIRNPELAKNVLMTQTFDILTEQVTIPEGMLGDIKTAMEKRDYATVKLLQERALTHIGENEAKGKGLERLRALTETMKTIDEYAKKYKQPYQVNIENAIGEEADRIFGDVQDSLNIRSEFQPELRGLDYNDMSVEDKMKILSYMTANPHPMPEDYADVKGEPVARTDTTGAPLSDNEIRALQADADAAARQERFETDLATYKQGLRTILTGDKKYSAIREKLSKINNMTYFYKSYR